MKHYDNEINRNKNWGWFTEYGKEFIEDQFGAENIKYFSEGTLAWEYCLFHFILSDGCNYEGRFTYAECNDGRGMLEIFRKVYNREKGKKELVEI